MLACMIPAFSLVSTASVPDLDAGEFDFMSKELFGDDDDSIDTTVPTDDDFSFDDEDDLFGDGDFLTEDDLVSDED